MRFEFRAGNWTPLVAKEAVDESVKPEMSAPSFRGGAVVPRAVRQATGGLAGWISPGAAHVCSETAWTNCPNRGRGRVVGRAVHPRDGRWRGRPGQDPGGTVGTGGTGAWQTPGASQSPPTGRTTWPPWPTAIGRLRPKSTQRPIVRVEGTDRRRGPKRLPRGRGRGSLVRRERGADDWGLDALGGGEVVAASTGWRA